MSWDKEKLIPWMDEVDLEDDEPTNGTPVSRFAFDLGSRAELDVALERRKQRSKYDGAHDDAYQPDALVGVASTVLVLRDTGPDASKMFELDDISAYILNKHASRRKRLVIAAALILAEIERMDRNAED